MSKELLLSLTPRAPHIELDINYIVVTWHVSAPIDSKVFADRSFARTSITVESVDEKKGRENWTIIQYCVKRKPVPDELWMHLLNPLVPQSTYTSTRIGKFASRNSSRQLGGKRICTEARVPCVSGISNVFILGRAMSSSFFENCFLVSYSTFTSRWVFAECTPVIFEGKWKKK